MPLIQGAYDSVSAAALFHISFEGLTLSDAGCSKQDLRGTIEQRACILLTCLLYAWNPNVPIQAKIRCVQKETK